MYKVIGADQKEYGPVSLEQVRQWISEGRANGETLVQAEGGTDWRPLSSFPELNELLTVTSLPSSPPAPELSTDPEVLATQIVARDYDLDIGECLRRSWELLKRNAGLLVGATAVFLVLVVVVNQLISLLTSSAVRTLMEGNIEPGAILIILLAQIPEVAFSGIMTGGFYLLLLKLIRGQAAGIGDLFAGFSPAAAQLALAAIVIQFLTLLGSLACLAPGVYLYVAWILTVPLIMDKGLAFWPAMELSRKVVTKHWWLMFCLFLVTVALSLAGLLACCVGILVALPVGFGALAYAYVDIFSGRGQVTY
jgi:uncharacterized membrane protein